MDKNPNNLGINLIKEGKDLYVGNSDKGKLKVIQRNGKISHVIGMEELILLKLPYYPKPSADLMWSLSNYLWYFSQS